MNTAAMRKSRKLSQAKFWNRVGITQTTGCRYENAKLELPAPIAVLLTIAYGNLREARRTVDALRK